MGTFGNCGLVLLKILMKWFKVILEILLRKRSGRVESNHQTKFLSWVQAQPDNRIEWAQNEPKIELGQVGYSSISREFCPHLVLPP